LKRKKVVYVEVSGDSCNSLPNGLLFMRQ